MTKVVLVTGASRGIGKGIALASSKAGWITYITGRILETLQSACEDIKEQSGNNVFPIVCDHNVDAQVKSAIDQIYETHGRVDVLVNNAYSALDSLLTLLSSKASFWERPLELWDATHGVGLRSHYVATALVAKRMVQNSQSGLIVNVSSPGGLSFLLDVSYGVGKAALDRMTADTSLQLLPANVTVVSLWPGVVETETVQKFMLNNQKGSTQANTWGMEVESPEFVGKGVVALVKDPNVIQFTGKVLLTVELAKYYKFTDVNNKIPGEAVMKLMRDKMKNPPEQWEIPSVFAQ